MIVVDTTAPALDLPDNLVTEATGPAGALVDFAASAVDLVSGSTPATCTPATGSSFPIGATEVTCRSTDGADNTTSGLFLVTVADTTPPALTVPEAISISASSPDGARVDYYVTAVDTVNGLVPVTGDPPSGSLFPVGTTTVTCTASDPTPPALRRGAVRAGEPAARETVATFQVTVLAYVAPTTTPSAPTSAPVTPTSAPVTPTSAPVTPTTSPALSPGKTSATAPASTSTSGSSSNPTTSTVTSTTTQDALASTGVGVRLPLMLAGGLLLAGVFVLLGTRFSVARRSGRRH